MSLNAHLSAAYQLDLGDFAGLLEVHMCGFSSETNGKEPFWGSRQKDTHLLQMCKTDWRLSPTAGCPKAQSERKRTESC